MSLSELWPTHKKLPHFLVLGTQKGGTTSLQKLLEQHPRVYLPPCKEVHYFSLHADESQSWYASHYRNAGWRQKRGDITPFYLFHPQAPKRIHRILPKVRLIALLRDPVERTLSQYFHARRHGFETLDLSEALEAEPKRLAKGEAYSFQKHSYVARSRYLEQLDRYEALFPRQQILILKSEDLFTNTPSVWKRIQHFLKLEQMTLPMNTPRANEGKGEADRIDPIIRTQLKEKLFDTADGVKSRYGIDWGWT